MVGGGRDTWFVEVGCYSFGYGALGVCWGGVNARVVCVRGVVTSDALEVGSSVESGC